MSELDFTGKKVLVVGGSSGIGNGVAHAFRARGAAVHVWGTRASAAEYDGVEGSDLNGLGYTSVDVSDPGAIAAAPAPFDTLDVLIHSQGTVLYGRKEFEREGWDKVMAVNVDSVMHISQKFKAELLAQKGSIVVVSSIAAIRSTVGNPAYAASKAAAVSLVKTLGQAWAPSGVRVNGFAPSLVDTKLTKITMDHPDRRERALAKIPLGRFGEVDEMANVALFLASPLASYLVGQTLIVDGGLTL
ncbi:MAG: SDR family oxidoreductase [Terricaulis sp.]|nr:SDR family oxidoreductase [Terricaulis sp.]